MNRTLALWRVHVGFWLTNRHSTHDNDNVAIPACPAYGYGSLLARVRATVQFMATVAYSRVAALQAHLAHNYGSGGLKPTSVRASLAVVLFAQN